MVQRKCPVCGLPWCSADAESVWMCPRCNADIPVEEVTKSDQDKKKKPLQSGM
ncbi:MAG: hypothetical protein ACOY46_19690 [Bacillota bacterium]